MLHRFSRLSVPSPSRLSYWAVAGAVALGCSLMQLPAGAEGAESTPSSIVEMLESMDRAASAQDVTRFLQAYSPEFRHEDGLNRRDFSRSLERFWNQYSELNYDTEVLSWDETSEGVVVETLTTIQGSREEKGRGLKLNATVRSQKTFEGDRLTRQEILAEESTVTTGAKPPQLSVSLPEQVKRGASFNFDVIVLEPLENDLLLGGVLDEPVSAGSYPNPSKVEVKPLVDPQTGTGPGGIFKVGQAPSRASDRWISAVVVRKDGITMVTRRLQVVN